jgi:hypothetical protein
MSMLVERTLFFSATDDTMTLLEIAASSGVIAGVCVRQTTSLTMRARAQVGGGWSE